MNDLTLLYYSAHALPPEVEENVRQALVTTVKNKYPIVSVTQKPISFGTNICVGDIGRSHYNCYKQILIGAKEIKTKYVAMIEDDTLYNLEHFAFRPKKGETFYFNKNMRFLEDDRFWHKGLTGMFACICETDLLIKTLAPRFEKYKEEPMPRKTQRHFWQEPGRDDKLGFPNQKVAYFETKIPLVVLNYFNGMDGKQKSSTNEPFVETENEFWGKARDLKIKIWGK